MHESAMRPGLKCAGWPVNRTRAGMRRGPRHTLSPLSACQMMFPIFLGQRVPPETLANTLAELDRSLQLLEDKILKDQDFLAGPHISVADLVAITELMHVSAVGQGGCLAVGYPRREPVHQLTSPFLAGGRGGPWVGHVPSEPQEKRA